MASRLDNASAHRKGRSSRWLPRSAREWLYKRDNWTCHYCKCSLFDWYQDPKTRWRVTLDHKVPRALGGGNDFDNLVSACHTCNIHKGKKVEFAC